MKILVVYYSFEGNTELIGNTIASTVGADTLVLKPVNEIKTKGFMKYVWGGSQVVMGKSPKLEPYEINPRDYDIIFIGTPVWAWTYTPPLNTFLKASNILHKKIALFTCHGGQNGKTFEKMKGALPGNQFIAQQDFFEPLFRNTDKNIEKAKQWAKEVINQLEL